MDKVKPYWEKIKTKIGELPKKAYVLAVLMIVALAAGITIFLNTRPYSALFTGLNQEELTSITAFLQEQGVTDYRLANNDTILVPTAQESQLKAKLLMAGYPKTGFSYSGYYEHVSALSTESERNRAFLISVMQNMEDVIRCFDGVKDAHVLITPGEDHSYVLDSNNVVDATASVQLILDGPQKLGSQQANAIRNLVAHGVQGLKIESVAIMDNFGNLYSVGDGAASGEASQLKLMLEEEYNNKIRTIVMQVLTPLFGPDNVKVGVNCTVDVSRSTENATDVKLPEWALDGSTKGEGIIGSKIWDDEVIRDPNTTTGGVVGTESNSDLSTYVEEELTPDGTEQHISSGGQIDYDNPRSETQTIRLAGYLTDCMVSVSINSTTAGNVDIPAIRTHVARAAGITEEMSVEKISVLPMAFYKEDNGVILPGADGLNIPTWALYAAGAGLALFVLLLILFMGMSRKRKKKKEALEAQELAAQNAALVAAGLAVPTAPEPEMMMGADVMQLNTEKGMELRKDIRDFVDENPQIAAQMVKAWLRGGKEDG